MCVRRAVFRICLQRFHELAAGDVYQDYDLALIGGFRADFLLLAKRTLSPELLIVFDLYHVRGKQWKDASRRVGAGKVIFLKLVYQVEEKLGEAILDTRPYSVFPLERYFSRFRAGRTSPAAFITLAA